MKPAIRSIIICGLLSLALPAGPLRAAFSRNDAGTATAAFLKMGVGARAAAMGEAFTGIADDVTAIYWNPAGTARLTRPSAALMHALWFEDIVFDWAAYAHPASFGVVGVSLHYLSYGDIKGTDESGFETGAFQPRDMAVTVSLARRFGAYSGGFALKHITSKIENSASGMAADMGFMYEADRFSSGLAIQNIGNGLAYDTGSDPLPLTVRAGAGYRVTPRLRGAVDLVVPSDYEQSISLGMEYCQPVSQLGSASVRGGYTTRTRALSGQKGFSFGLGLSYAGVSFDYAFMPFGDLGSTHRTSISIKF
jgi:hypothetical protein